MLMEADDFRERLAEEIRAERAAPRPGDRENPRALLEACARANARRWPRWRRRWRNGTAGCCSKSRSKAMPEATWEEAESCLEVLRRRKAEEELAAVQRQIEAQPAARARTRTATRCGGLQRKQELRRLAGTGTDSARRHRNGIRPAPLDDSRLV